MDLEWIYVMSRTARAHHLGVMQEGAPVAIRLAVQGGPDVIPALESLETVKEKDLPLTTDERVRLLRQKWWHVTKYENLAKANKVGDQYWLDQLHQYSDLLFDLAFRLYFSGREIRDISEAEFGIYDPEMQLARKTLEEQEAARGIVQ